MKSYILSLCLALSLLMVYANTGQSDSLRIYEKPGPEAEKSQEQKQPQKDTKEEETLSLPENALQNAKDDDVALFLPEDADNVEFLSGAWHFDRDFVDSKGKAYRTRFSFNEKGEGSSSLTDEKGVQYFAKARASLEGGILKIETDRYENDTSNIVYTANAFACKKVGKELVCDSTDGSWKRERLLADNTETKERLQKLVKKKEPKEERLSFPKEAARKLPQQNEALRLPKDAEDLEFVEGKWRFDRDFLDAEGNPVHAEFVFDEKGKGEASLTNEKGERFEASANARLEDGSVKVETSRYANKDESVTYPPMFFECKNVGGEVICKGTDGWSLWDNEHLVAVDEKARQSVQEASQKKENASPSKSQDDAEGQQKESRQDSGVAELVEGGAELPPQIMEHAEKAKADGTKSPLAGNWRYSRDFARKSDGSSVALEFHFDESGKGYSVIKDGINEARAEADVISMPNGNVRVKTSGYTGKDGKNYYPTFMECRESKNKEFDCDVSNGWMRLNNGSLISLDSINRQEKETVMEELTPVKQEEAKKKSREDILTQFDLDEKPAKPAKPAEEKAAQSRQLVLPKDDSSMQFLKGRWRCNTGLVRTSDGQPVVVEFSFDGNGHGSSSVRETSGIVYNASASATYKNRRLRINTSDFYSKKARGKYMGQFMECRQVGDRALCHGHAHNNSVSWDNATFTRIK